MNSLSYFQGKPLSQEELVRFYNYVILSAILFLFLSPALISAATGDVAAQFAAPGTCPTGLAFDGKYIWMADRKSDLIYKIDPADGSVKQTFNAPGYHIAILLTGRWNKPLTLPDTISPALRSRRNVSGCWMSKKNLSIAGIRKMGLAWDGKYLWVADYRQDRLFQISIEDGTTITDIPSPSRNPQGLTFDGRYLWVSDRYDDMIYMVYPENGNVILAFESPSKYARGLAYDGEYLWNVDYQSDSLYKIILDDEETFIQTDGKKQELEFTHQVRNYGPGELTSLDIYIALPKDLPFQKLLDTLEFNPQPIDFPSDQWDQKTAHYHFENVPAGELHWTISRSRLKICT